MRLFESDPAAMAEAPAIYRELREAGPVHELGPRVLVTRHPDVKALIRDGVNYSNASRSKGTVAEEARARLSDEHKLVFDEVAAFEAMYVSRADGATHDRLRRIAHRAFTPRKIAELGDVTVRYVDELLAPLDEGALTDLMTIAYRLPLMVITDLLGVPQGDREQIHVWTEKLGRNRGGTQLEPLLAAHHAMREFRAYIEEGLEQLRRKPGSTDLIAALVGAEQDERLSPEELTAMFAILLFAGHETTTNLIGIGVLELLRSTDQWQLLCCEPETLALPATEELLRWVSPVQYGNRLVVNDVTIAGTTIGAGATVWPMHAAANRDPEVFANAETLDISRSDSAQHLALGFGAHFCLGASLARLECRIAVQALATRFPNLSLAGDSIEWTGNSALRRLVSLPVDVGRQARARRKPR